MAEINGWMTVRDAAEKILGVSPQRVHQLIAAYNLETFNVTRRMKMVKRAEIEKLAQSERPSGVHLDGRNPPKKRPRKSA